MRKIILLILVLVGLLLLSPVSVFADGCTWVKVEVSVGWDFEAGDIIRLDTSKQIDVSGEPHYKGCGLTSTRLPVKSVNLYGSASIGQAVNNLYHTGRKIPAGSTFVILKERIGAVYIWWDGYEEKCPAQTREYKIIGSIPLNEIWNYNGSSIVSSKEPVATATPRPPTATPISPASTNTSVPPSPTTVLQTSTPVPATNTPRPKADSVIARVTIAPTNPPQPTATALSVAPTNPGAKGESFSDKLGLLLGKLGGFLLNCALFVVGCLVLYAIFWSLNDFRKARQEEKLEKKARDKERRERTEDEWRSEFVRCLRAAQKSLKQKPPDVATATMAFLEADKLLGFANYDERKELKKIRRRLFELGVKKI